MGAEEDCYIQFMAERVQPPPLTSGDTLHWDGRGAISQGVELAQGAEPGACAVIFRSTGNTGCRGPSHACRRGLWAPPASSAPAIDWARAAASLTFYLDPKLLLAPVYVVLPGVTGSLLYVHGRGDEESITPAVHPALLVQTASASRQGAYVELVPHLPLDDPLHHHIASVLQAAVAAEGMADRLYAEALANALADHLLRRYAACWQPERVFSGGLTPRKLQRTTAYIQAHLEHELSLVELAAVAQMSPSHFAHLFKRATGLAPHQYVSLCRIEHAKRLLAETDLALIEIAAQVGCADQSHFAALFKKHVGTTPKAYRNDTTRSSGLRHTAVHTPWKDASGAEPSVTPGLTAIVRGIGAPPARFAYNSNVCHKNVTDGASPILYLSDTRGVESLTSGALVPSWRGGRLASMHTVSPAAECGKDRV